MTNYSTTPHGKADAKELAYLYDLYFVPGWRELFDQMMDETVKPPKEGKFLDAGCGTGGYAIELATRLGHQGEVVGIDDSPERLALAHGKVEIGQLENIRFAYGTLEELGVASDDFDFVIADLSLLSPTELPDRLNDILAELKRVAKQGATVVLKLATRTSFDEFYSVYWEALYEADLLAYTEQIEDLINERLTIEQLEGAARNSGFRQIESLTEKSLFAYESAAEFFAAPLIEHAFLGHWLGVLASESEEREVRAALTRIIDRECEDGAFELSAKTTLLIAKR